MIRDIFIEHLELNCNCEVVRHDKKGFSVIRVIGTKTISGIPKGENLNNITICRICNTLGVEVPEFAQHVQPIIDEIEQKHNGKK